MILPALASVLGQQGGGGGFGIAGTATSIFGGTSGSADLPADIGSGDVLLMGVRTSNNAAGTISVSGWSLVTETSDGFSLLTIWSRIATGSEGATVTVADSLTTNKAAIVYRVTGAHGDVVGASNEGVNPPSVTPAWGPAENIFVAFLGNRQGPTTATNPTGYTDQLFQDWGLTDNSNAAIHSSTRTATATTENPSPWVLSGANVRQNSATIAVRPA